MSDKFLKKEFKNRQEKIILDPYETCPYKKICPHRRISNIECLGCNENRPWKFICDVKRLKEY